MAEKRNAADELRGLLEQLDDRLREAERLRSYADERSHRPLVWPDRRRTPRVDDERPTQSRSERTLERDRRG
jgi:hypothetical protein